MRRIAQHGWIGAILLALTAGCLDVPLQPGSALTATTPRISRAKASRVLTSTAISDATPSPSPSWPSDSQVGPSDSPSPTPTASDALIASSTPSPTATPWATPTPWTTPTPWATPTPWPSPGSTPDPQVTVFAGGALGFRNAVGADAQFSSPNGIALDAAGDLFIADSGNNCIREVTPAGLATTVAGGAQGNLEGTRTSARFDSPYGVAVGPDGTVYVADTYNNSIRKIAPNGVTATLAGNGTAGYKDGSGTVAEFNLPFSLALDASGNLYVADAGNNRIRKVSPVGDVSTIAGNGIAAHADGSALSASFSVPNDVAVDSQGDVFVADYGNNCVREITFGGQVSTLAGTGVLGYQDGAGVSAEFDHPTGIAIDASGTLYVADNGNNRIRLVKPSGVTSTLAGFGTPGATTGDAPTAEFDGPTDVGIAGQGKVYVVDTGNDRIGEIKL